MTRVIVATERWINADGSVDTSDIFFQSYTSALNYYVNDGFNLVTSVGKMSAFCIKHFAAKINKLSGNTDVMAGRCQVSFRTQEIKP